MNISSTVITTCLIASTARYASACEAYFANARKSADRPIRRQTTIVGRTPTLLTPGFTQWPKPGGWNLSPYGKELTDWKAAYGRTIRAVWREGRPANRVSLPLSILLVDDPPPGSTAREKRSSQRSAVACYSGLVWGSLVHDPWQNGSRDGFGESRLSGSPTYLQETKKPRRSSEGRNPVRASDRVRSGGQVTSL